MKIFRLALRPVLAVVACASIAACANTSPPRSTDMDYRSRSSTSTSTTQGAQGSSDQRLTIQSGEGEKLNLPWFIQDTQDWINSN
ncbi:hypothetical protein [Achromobacter piechaudii]|uniref:Lipoprotein n=2 Tax=Achromobacter piechaudii TaxID=72556 RepID=D4XCD9_9BURK|nr:hypothetical protein [Achromobacter piechaudii]EFF75519.1 hypothetical protein HMPREF0004_3136 [Achromobacter piechaudii ATCC 43553]KNY10755.1 hypothetical protein AKG08_11215 [Achromobacter piechaudii]